MKRALKWSGRLALTSVKRGLRGSATPLGAFSWVFCYAGIAACVAYLPLWEAAIGGVAVKAVSWLIYCVAIFRAR